MEKIMKKRNKKPNLKKMKYDPRKVTMAPMFLGNVIMKYELPKNMINDINSSYDEAKELPEWNNHLAGKIEEEKLVNELMTEDMLSVFLSCFATYIQYIQKNQWRNRSYRYFRLCCSFWILRSFFSSNSHKTKA